MTPSKEDEVGFTSQQWVWFPDEKNTFLKGYIVDPAAEPSSTGKIKVQCEKTGNVVDVDEDKLEKVNPPKFDKCDDMASLTYLNEPSVLHNLGLRYNDDLIYTYSGLFLVAVNPYKKLNIYTNELISSYHKQNKKKKENNNKKPKPHIFAVTENAFQNLINDKQHQSILVTGESGAGKTENTKKIIQYLTSITSIENKAKTDDINFEKKILEANPILESFGNAQTLKNNNSSRFGKFIKLDFNPSSRELIGANFEWYLLEKSRVVCQDENERNYHIFYQILSGLSDHELSALSLKRSVSEYNYLNKANHTIPGMDDKSEYEHLVNALKTVNFELKEIASIIKVIAVILLLGNIEFANPNSDKQAILADSSPITELCKLLDINDRQLFINAFLKPRVKAGKEFVSQQKNSKQVKFSVDALAKSLYEKLFGYIVDGINKSFIIEEIERGNADNNKKFIGILDIAGFEIFPKNSFEQLCINYTNEKLQQFFNHHMFVLEQNEYLKENLNWKFIDFGNDLIPTIDLIEKKNRNEFGIFAILDEECIVPNASDRSFFDKLNQNLENKDRSLKKDSLRYRPNKNRTGFVIKHYAGEVEYDTEGWLDKNRDPLSDAVVELIYNSSNNQFVKSFYKTEAEILLLSQNNKSKKNGAAKQGSMLRTVAHRHKTQLNELMDQLDSTDPHFVRCILPNNNKKLGEFDNELILNQLRCNGVLEGIRIARAGYPNRIVFSEFYQRYKILCKNQAKFSKSETNASLKRNCELLLGELLLDPEIFKVGSTKLFFKNGVLAELEKRREHTIESIMIGFQSLSRGKLNRDVFKKRLLKLQASHAIAESFRTYNKLKEDPWFNLFVRLKPLVDSDDSSAGKKVFTDKINKLKNDISTLKQEKSLMQTENKQFNARLDKVNQSLAKERELLETKEAELDKMKEFEIELQENLNLKVSELKKLKADLEELIDENKELKNKFTQSSENVQNSHKEVEQLNTERNSLTEKIESLSQELETVGLEHSKSVSEHAKLLEEIKMLKTVVREKDLKIQVLEKEIISNKKDLETKLATANTGYNIASKKLKEAIEQKDDLQLQLSKLRTSNNSVDNVIKEKEEKLKALGLVMDDEQVKILALEKERDTIKSKHESVKKELLTAKEELKKLTKKHQRLQNDLEQSRALLNSKIEDDVKFSRGKEVHDRDILDLKETINDLKEKLTSNFGNDATSSENLVKSLRIENEQLLKVKKNLDIKIAELTFQLRNRSPSPTTSFDGLHSSGGRSLQDEYASLKLQLNETTAEATRIGLENKHLKEEISLIQTRLASESFENRQLKLERNKRIKTGTVDLIEMHNDENQNPLSNSSDDNRLFSRETAELRIQLDSEKRTNKRIELLNISLQKELSEYKNSAYKSLAVNKDNKEDSEIDEYKAKYQILEAKIMALESQLKNSVSSPLQDSTQSVLNGASSSYRSASTIQNENLRLSAKLNELASQLKRYKSNNNASTLKQDDFDNLKSRFSILEVTNADLETSLELYKRRANEYYGKLESADAAVKSARRSEEILRREKNELQTTTETLRKESKLNDNQMVKLNSHIRSLEQKLSDLKFENQKLSKNIDLLNDKYENEKELRSSTSSSISQTHAREIKQLNDEIKERMEHETEMSKTIKYLSLELDDTKNKASNYESKCLELSDLKSHLEKMNFSLKQQNDKLQISNKEIENKLETLVSQVTALRSINEDVVIERDNLLAKNRSLEVKVKSVTDEFNKFLKKNDEETANKVSINELQKDLENEKKISETIKLKLNDKELNLQKMMDKYNSLKQDSITTIEENKLLTKFNTQLIEKMKDLQLKSNIELEKTELTWQERVKSLESRIKEFNDLKINDEQTLYNMTKLAKDMKSRYEEQKTLTSRYRLENHELDVKLNQLNMELENLRKMENKSALLLKRSERELNEYKETCLNLEKELLNWKNI